MGTEGKPVEELIAALLWRISVFEARLRMLREAAGAPHAMRPPLLATEPVPTPDSTVPPSAPLPACTSETEMKYSRRAARAATIVCFLAVCAVIAYGASLWVRMELLLRNI